MINKFWFVIINLSMSKIEREVNTPHYVQLSYSNECIILPCYRFNLSTFRVSIESSDRSVMNDITRSCPYL